jgi:hypothetical protein
MSTGDGVECDDVDVDVRASNGAEVLRLANDAKRLVLGVAAKLIKLILGETAPIISNWITNLITVVYKVDE